MAKASRKELFPTLSPEPQGHNEVSIEIPERLRNTKKGLAIEIDSHYQ